MSGVDFDKLSEQLSAYLDGELSGRERAAVEAVLKKSEPARKRLAELKQVTSLVGALPRHLAPESIAEDLMKAAERIQLLDDNGRAGQAPGGGWRIGLGVLAVAAVVTLFVTVALQFGRSPGESLFGLPLASLDKGEGTAAEPHHLGEGPVGSQVTQSDDAWSAPRGRNGVADETRRRPHGKKAPDEVTSAAPHFWEIDLESEDLIALAAVANVTQKLTAGVDNAGLRAHQFSNESNVLSVAFADAASRGAAADRLVSDLVLHGSIDLAQSTEPPQNRDFYYHGNVDYNFDASDEEQILVHVRTSQLSRVLHEVGGSADSPADVRLQIGPIAARGYEPAQALIQIAQERYASGGDRKTTASLEEDAESSSTDQAVRRETLAGEAVLRDVVKVLAGKSEAPSESSVDMDDKAPSEQSEQEDAAEPDESSQVDAPVATGKGEERRRSKQKDSDRAVDEEDVPERTPLVERRLDTARKKKAQREGLRKAQDSAEEEPAPGAGAPWRQTPQPETRQADPTDDPYVTLVVRLLLKPPPGAKVPPSSRARPQNANDNSDAKPPSH